MTAALPSRDNLTLDEAFQQSVGELGRGQRCRFCLVHPFLACTRMRAQGLQDVRRVTVHSTRLWLTVHDFHLTLLHMFLQAGLALVPAAMQTFSMYFVALDPFRQQAWWCREPEDASCQAAQRAAGHTACHLPPEAWHWLNRCEIDRCCSTHKLFKHCKCAFAA